MNNFNQMLKIVFAIFALNLIYLSSIAQQITSNDGFEGTSQRHQPPPHWNNSESGPSSVDTQPNIFGNNVIQPTQGETYISMITRKIGPPGSKETAWADLLTPWEKDKCYTVDIDLSLSNQFNATYQWTQVFYFNEKPCIFQIIGFNGEIHNTDDFEILWESGELYDAFWQTFTAEISPQNNTYEKIALRPNFAIEGEFKNTVVLVDNLKYPTQENILTDENDLLNVPNGATEISWYFEGELIPNANSNQMPVLGSGNYEARFFDENDCFVITSEYIDIDYDHLASYPVPTQNEVSIESFSLSKGNFIFRLFNEIGQLVLIEEKEVLVGVNTITLNLNHLPAAIYFLQIERIQLEPLVSKLVVVNN